MQGRCYLGGYLFDYIVQRYILIEVLQAVNKLDFAFSYSSSDIDSIGNADQVCVFEFDAGTLVAVVQKNIQASGLKGCGYLFSGGQ